MREKNYTKHALKGFAIILIMSVLGGITSYIFRMILARKLSISDYGLFFSIYSFMAILFLLRDLGSGSAMLKYIPELLAQKKYRDVKFMILLGFLLTLIPSIVFLILYTSLANQLSLYYLKSAEYGFIIVLFVLASFGFVIDAYVANIMAALQKHSWYAFMQFLRQLVPLMIIIIFVRWSNNIILPIVAYMISSVILLILFLFVLRSTLRSWKKYPLKGYNSTLVKKTLIFGSYVTIASVGGIVLQYADNVLLTLYLTTYSVGIYNAALPIANVFTYIGAALSIVIIPLTAELWSRNMKKNISESVYLVYKYLMVILLPVCMVVMIFSSDMLRILFGPQFVSATNTLRVLIFATLFYTFSQINLSIFSGIGKPAITIKIVILGGIISIVTSVLLIPIYGIIGVAISLFLGYLFMSLVGFWILRKYIDIRFPIIEWIKSGVFSVIFLGFIILLIRILHIHWILALFISGVVYLALAIMFKSIDIEEIRYFMRRSQQND